MSVAGKTRGRSRAWKLLCAGFLASAASATGCSATSSVAPATDASGVTDPGGEAGVETGEAGPSANDAGAYEDGSSPDAGPDASFNAGGLTVVAATADGGSADGGAETCALTPDGRYLLVTIANEGATTVGSTTVRVATNGATYQTGLPTPSLAPGGHEHARVRSRTARRPRRRLAVHDHDRP